MRIINVPEAVVNQQIEAIRRQSRNHIFCDCNNAVMFCGVHLQRTSGDTTEMPDGDECPDCYLVWIGGYCPYCGFHWTEEDYKSQGL